MCRKTAKFHKFPAVHCANYVSDKSKLGAQCIAVTKSLGIPQFFGTAITFVAHCCAEKLRNPPIFRHSNAPFRSMRWHPSSDAQSEEQRASRLLSILRLLFLGMPDSMTVSDFGFARTDYRYWRKHWVLENSLTLNTLEVTSFTRLIKIFMQHVELMYGTSAYSINSPSVGNMWLIKYYRFWLSFKYL